ncbi:RNA polymerase subunit sigma-70, partial [Flavobacteriaceae bacterium]|nr:RNA polymerase subunit sigma-70 [Flavobacteriaceae bacterium]
MDYNELIQKAKANNQQAFNTLFDMLWDDVYTFLFKKTLHHQIAEELSVETFTKAFDRLDTYKTTYSFKTWLLTIAKNNHIDFTRRYKQNIEVNI